MFGHCCDHATIVASRPPFLVLMKAAATSRPDCPTLTVPKLPGTTQPNGGSSTFAPSRVYAQDSARTESNRIIFGGAMRFAAVNLSITRPRPCRQLHIRRLTSNVFGRQSRHFCATCTFCARFRHATTPSASRSAQRVHPDLAIEQDRRRLFASCSIADRMRQRQRSTDQTFALRVTIVPLLRAKPPRACPAPDPFCCFFLQGG
jgi:hypothetical protein